MTWVFITTTAAALAVALRAEGKRRRLVADVRRILQDHR